MRKEHEKEYYFAVLSSVGGDPRTLLRIDERCSLEVLFSRRARSYTSMLQSEHLLFSMKYIQRSVYSKLNASSL